MNNLKKIREYKNLKQIEVSNYLKVDQTTYSRYERGIRNIDNDTLIKLSEFFDVCTDYLLGIIDVPLTSAELEFVSKVDNEDEDLLEEYDLILAGEKVTKEEAKMILKIMRSMNEDK